MGKEAERGGVIDGAVLGSVLDYLRWLGVKMSVETRGRTGFTRNF